MITVKSNPINKINQFIFDITSRIERDLRYAYLGKFLSGISFKPFKISKWTRNSRKIPFLMKNPVLSLFPLNRTSVFCDGAHKQTEKNMHLP